MPNNGIKWGEGMAIVRLEFNRRKAAKALLDCANSSNIRPLSRDDKLYLLRIIGIEQLTLLPESKEPVYGKSEKDKYEAVYWAGDEEPKKRGFWSFLKFQKKSDKRCSPTEKALDLEKALEVLADIAHSNVAKRAKRAIERMQYGKVLNYSKKLKGCDADFFLEDVVCYCIARRKAIPAYYFAQKLNDEKLMSEISNLRSKW